MRYLLVLVCLLLSGCGSLKQVGTPCPVSSSTEPTPSGPAPTIGGVSASPDANTIVFSWGTSIAASTSASCGSHNSPNDASQNSVTSHVIPVPGLLPSTSYTCQVCSNGACQTINATTSAYATSTPITGITIPTPTNYNTTSPPPLYKMYGDSFVNTISNDGINYLAGGDTTGYSGAKPCSYTTILAKFTSLSPPAAENVNTLKGLGAGCTGLSNDGNLSPKPAGLLSLGGTLFMTLTNGTQAGGSGIGLFKYGSMMFSLDHGATWNNQSASCVFNSNGMINLPYTTRLWPNGPPYFDASSFVMQGADDGTLGYTTTANRVLNANVYIYGISNALTSGGGVAAWNNGDAYYLWRVPRSQMIDLNPSEYQFYIGGDGTQDSAWSTTQSSAVAIITNDGNRANMPANPGELSDATVQYIPALNRYLLITYFYPSGNAHAVNSVWLAYESPTPWGTWTPITVNFDNTVGYYDAFVLQSDALSATSSSTTMRLFLADNFEGPNYNMFYATMTVNH